MLSHAIDGRTPLYGGKRSVAVKRLKAIRAGDGCNMLYLSFPNHVGTHIDAPRHFIERGRTITDLKPEEFIFDNISMVKINDIRPGYKITPEDIGPVKDCELLLIKTGFESNRGKALYWKNGPGLTPELAHWLKGRCRSLRAIGVDCISISNLRARDTGRQAHKAFLGNDIFIIEDIKLSSIKKVPDMVIALPLLVSGADGAPCTILGLYTR